MRRVAVLGGGAIGLSAADLLQRNGVEVCLLEAGSQVGGLLGTFEVADGVRLERFYHHFFTHDAEIRWLLDELGLRDQVRFEPSTMGMYRGGCIYPFNGPGDVFSFGAIPLAARLRFGASAAMLSYAPGYADAEHIDALRWFERWAGGEATEAIWRPMLEVKFGMAASTVPLAWIAGRLRQRVRSREGTEERLGYLEGSLQRLVDSWVKSLTERSVEILTGAAATRLLTRGGRVHGVEAGKGVVEADAVLSTIPTPLLAELVRPESPGYADELARITYSGAICVILALPERLSPVYWLNVADSGFDFGGVIEHTNLIPPAEYGGRHIVYLSRYVSSDHPLWALETEQLLDRAIDQLEQMFRTEVRERVMQHWVFKGRFAAPLPGRRFHSHIPAFRSPLPGLFVAAMPHVYPDERSTNNSIRIAATAVGAMGFDTSFVPHHHSLAGKYGR